MNEYVASYYPYRQHPDSDSTWSLSVGPDGRIYAGACCESVPGKTVKLVRYNETTDSLDHLCDLDKAVEDPRDSGRATQCKIHYGFAPSMHDGIMYMATHLSGAPFDLPAYSPWYYWHDEKRCFRGSALLAWDTKTDTPLWWSTMIPKEGCRCIVHDEERRLLYSISYPRDHFYSFDLKTRMTRDVGRIGSVNAQTLFIDRKHRIWTTSDYGRLVRYDPETDRLDESPYILPHNQAYQNGWHSVFYDVVGSPDGECVYAVNWVAHPRLTRIWLYEGPWGRVEDLGPVTQDHDPRVPMPFHPDHCGGLTFGGDGQLYFVTSRRRDPVYNPGYQGKQDVTGVLVRVNPGTLESTDLLTFELPDGPDNYVSRGASDRNGDLFFGYVYYKHPAGLVKVTMPAERRKKNAHLPIRMWG